jgi:hypothetical protein
MLRFGFGQPGIVLWEWSHMGKRKPNLITEILQNARKILRVGAREHEIK